jgi:hypothetical protein
VYWTRSVINFHRERDPANLLQYVSNNCNSNKNTKRTLLYTKQKIQYIKINIVKTVKVAVGPIVGSVYCFQSLLCRSPLNWGFTVMFILIFLQILFFFGLLLTFCLAFSFTKIVLFQNNSFNLNILSIFHPS